MTQTLKIGTRGSQLALWQANHIKSEIEAAFPDIPVEIVTIKTKGDQITDRPLAKVGGKGLFVKEIEQQLLEKKIDLAVHSMKDMPGELPEGLTIGAVPERENPFDVLIAQDNAQLSDFKPGARIGTSSLRRASQIKHIRPDLTILNIRGNLDTRIRKLRSGEYDAIILAAAGLIRLGQAGEISQYLTETQMVPAVGQGALCIEVRQDDKTIAPVMAALNDPDTQICVNGERSFLKHLGGSCHIPVACFGKLSDSRVILTGLVASEDGSTIISEQTTGAPEDAEQLGISLADTLLTRGGKTILENLQAND
ncbi:MAG: hydroxymethylbilane synthase [Desulfobacteraceae bacterium]|nr:MAG: hydroxymethylbilane synthase [Desulfobacteraceae bacterium]